MVVNTEPTILIPNDRYDQRFLDNSFSPNSHDAGEMYYHHQPSSPTSPEQYYQYSQQAMNLTAEYGMFLVNENLVKWLRETVSKA